MLTPIENTFLIPVIIDRVNGPYRFSILNKKACPIAANMHPKTALYMKISLNKKAL